MSKISGKELKVYEVFCSQYDFIIPPYQRPYAWTEVQAGELFSDLIDFFRKEPEDAYFLGSFVLIKEEGKAKAEVIDGQQRLTTLTILLAALAHLSSGPLRDLFKNYLCEPGNVLQGLLPKPRLALRERDRKFFADYVQGGRLGDLIDANPAQLDNESQRLIRLNAKYFLEKLTDAFQGDEAALTAFGGFLVQRCVMVAVTTPSEQSAFRVFSVLNSRGKDLLPTDIIKSHVIGRIKGQTKQDEFTERWEEIEVQTGRDGFAELFAHIRMIYARKKASRTLLEEFPEHVMKTAPSSEALMTEVIDPYAKAYLLAKNCAYQSTQNAAEINALLAWLNRIDNADWLPSAIRFLVTNGQNEEYVHWFLRKLERLAAVMHVCAFDVNERIERYAMLLAELDAPHSSALPLASIELTAAEKQRMRTALDGDIYNLFSRRRNYLLLRLDSFVSSAAVSHKGYRIY